MKSRSCSLSVWSFPSIIVRIRIITLNIDSSSESWSCNSISTCLVLLLVFCHFCLMSGEAEFFWTHGGTPDCDRRYRNKADWRNKITNTNGWNECRWRCSSILDVSLFRCSGQEETPKADQGAGTCCRAASFHLSGPPGWSPRESWREEAGGGGVLLASSLSPASRRGGSRGRIKQPLAPSLSEQMTCEPWRRSWDGTIWKLWFITWHLNTCASSYCGWWPGFSASFWAAVFLKHLCRSGSGSTCWWPRSRLMPSTTWLTTGSTNR